MSRGWAACVVFGEREHDREVVKELVKGLCPEFPVPRAQRKPLVLFKGRERARQRKTAADLRRAAEIQLKRRGVNQVVVFAHEDADDVEPAHLPLAETIEASVGGGVVTCVAVVPAWETEAWLFLWPDAARAVVSGWRRPVRTGEDVGQIRHAKEAYRRAVRPQGGKRSKGKVPDDQESHSPWIVRAAREAGGLDSCDARSDSFERFRERLLAV